MFYRWAATALTLFLGLWACFTAGWPSAGWLLAAGGFLAVLAETDLKTGELPNVLTLGLLALGLLCAPWATGVGRLDSVLGAGLGLAIGMGVLAGSVALTGKPGWGGGDVKLLAALGAWVGWFGMLPVILVASCLAVVWIYALGWLKGKRVKKMVFGPFLALAGWLAMLYQPAFWAVMVGVSRW